MNHHENPLPSTAIPEKNKEQPVNKESLAMIFLQQTERELELVERDLQAIINAGGFESKHVDNMRPLLDNLGIDTSGLDYLDPIKLQAASHNSTTRPKKLGEKDYGDLLREAKSALLARFRSWKLKKIQETQERVIGLLK